MSITARHFAKRAPCSKYFGSRSASLSRPLVMSSPGHSGSGAVPSSTLMPGMEPAFFIS
jgi:hypothetical protein